jgi:ubiquinone/menaquinone biosynthesis C-methylase UbiE
MNDAGQVQDYTPIAGTYDETRYQSPDHRFNEQLRADAILELLRPLEPDMTVADVATGTGRGALYMAPSVKQVIGIDGTPAMLERARANADRAGIANVEFVVGDAFRLAFPDGMFDRVISLNFLHLFLPVERQALLVEEMARVLKPGGKLVVELDNALHGGPLGAIRMWAVKDIGYNWPWDVRRMFAPSGLEIVAVAGTNLSGLWRLRRFSPRLIQWLEERTRYGPIRNLKQRLLVAARKPGCSRG